MLILNGINSNIKGKNLYYLYLFIESYSLFYMTEINPDDTESKKVTINFENIQMNNT